MIGIRVGVSVGSRVGAAVGVSANEVGPDTGGGLSSVSRDATSNIYVPASSSQWSSVMSSAGLATGGPSLLWLAQEATGSLADSIGTFTGTLAGGPPTYQQAVAGWSRKGISGTDGGSGVFSNTDAGLPDLTTQSMLVLVYAVVTTPASARGIMDFGAALISGANLTTGPLLQCSAGSTVNGASNPTGAVRPILLLHDATNNRAAVFSDQEKIIAAKRATTGKRIRILNSYLGSFVYVASFFGSAAELSDAQVKTLLQTLGWTIPWT